MTPLFILSNSLRSVRLISKDLKDLKVFIISNSRSLTIKFHTLFSDEKVKSFCPYFYNTKFAFHPLRTEGKISLRKVFCEYLKNDP